MSALSSLFPVQLNTQWQSQLPALFEERLAHWLLDPSSLTARLKKHCHEFKVEVLGQKIEACSEEDACDIILAGSEVLVREVVLYCDDSPQVFARSLLPLSSLTGDEQALAHLGSQPLGQVIFSKPNLVRSAIEVGCFNRNSTVAHLAEYLKLPKCSELWGRRSLFRVDNKPFVVAEVFLPNAFAYQRK